jgi:L-lactate dehydrogenase (cytochrome)
MARSWLEGRRRPTLADLRPLVRPRPIVLDTVERRLARAHTVADIRAIAQRRTPRPVFDYTDGGAEEESSMRRAREAFDRVEFIPRVLRDVSSVDTSTELFGERAALPLVFAPTGFTRLMHTDGEVAVARVAEELGVPCSLSTLGTTSIEELAAAAPKVRRWFQLYVWRDRAASQELIDRALAAGYEALLLTVDVPVAGARLRDVRNGFTIPPSLAGKALVDIALKPAWWLNFLTREPVTFASLRSWDATVAELINQVFDPALNFDDLAWLRSAWPKRLLVKGVQCVDDAKAVVDLGVDGLVISNHGGRQLDRAPVPLELLPGIVDAVGDRAEVYMDGGVRSGSDIVAAVALGAKACLIGRAYLYGLMAGGHRGVQRVADILSTEVRRTMQLLGVNTISELGRDYIRIRP